MKSKAVDAYIANSAAFAQPILKRLRGLMHKACPRIEETMKWGVPHFAYRGIVASMAAFKRHAAFGFWKRRLLPDPDALFKPPAKLGMGGRRIETMADLPSDAVLVKYIKAAVALNEQGIGEPREIRPRKPPPRAPADLLAALRKNAKARATYDGFPPSKKREYVEWITEARQDATRKRRLADAVAWMAQGKSRHWKYQNR